MLERSALGPASSDPDRSREPVGRPPTADRGSRSDKPSTRPIDAHTRVAVSPQHYGMVSYLFPAEMDVGRFALTSPPTCPTPRRFRTSYSPTRTRGIVSRRTN
jgi:hypothetical protein